MKSALVVFALLTLALVANAQSKQLPSPAGLPVELCQLDVGNSENAEETFEEVQSLDIKEINSLTGFQLNLVNQHLIEEQYTSKALSFAEIKALFGEDGQEEYNGLYIVTLKSKKTGKLYIEVKSYPGDNPYGLIFEAQTGKLLAKNGDDSITLLTPKGDLVSCYDLEK